MRRYYSFGLGADDQTTAWACLVAKRQSIGQTVADMTSQTGLTAQELEHMVNMVAASGTDAAIATFALLRNVSVEDAKKAPTVQALVASLLAALKEVGCLAPAPSAQVPAPAPTPTYAVTGRAILPSQLVAAGIRAAAPPTPQQVTATPTTAVPSTASKILPIAAVVLLAAALLR